MFKIIEIAEKDISLSAEIVRRSCSTIAEQFELTEENAPTNGSFLKDHTLLAEFRRGAKMFGLFDDDVQIGFVQIESNDGDIYNLEKLAVLSEHRHKGGGVSLLDYAVEYVRNADGKAISIGIIYENTSLLEWYERYGFEQTKTQIYPHLPFTVCFLKYEV
ncbi:MAG: GNAT family N-acetyltransferase [Oscillospiraceae bacterium]|nr:GNAT family N-acetyltransferase [Oscillospiraceae bacterium]